MKKVLFITNLASPYRVRFFDELGKFADVTVVYTDSSQDHRDREKAWFENARGNFREVQLKKGKSKVCFGVIDYLKQPFDDIILCGYSNPTFMLAIFYMKAKKIPFCMEADGGLVREEGKLKFLFKRCLVGAATTWLSSGQGTTDYFCYYGAKRDQVYLYPFTSLTGEDILPNIPTEAEKLALRRELGVEEDQMVLSVGRFIPGKGYDVLMQAAPLLEKSVGIYIVGGEPTEEYLQMQRQLNLSNVHFVGFRKKEELAKYYRSADVFVLPTRSDVWGLVINEAMACGLPIVTTDKCVAGVELIENGVNGYVIPVDDVSALAEKTNAVLSADPRKMGQAALETIRPYTIDGMVKAHLDFFNR